MFTVRRVMPGCSISYRGMRYFHPLLYPYMGTKVLVQQRENCLEVQDCHGNRICTADEFIFTEET